MTIKTGDCVTVIHGKYSGNVTAVEEVATDPGGKWVKLVGLEDWIPIELVVPNMSSDLIHSIYSTIPTVEIEYLNPDAGIEKHGNWWDIKLPSSNDIFVKAGDYIELPLGIKTLLPKGYEAHVLPRSSTFRKYGLILTNSMGLIDDDYTLEWKAFFYATRYDKIPIGARLVQFTIVPTVEFSVKEVPSLSHYTDRGESGSSGI